MGLKPRAFLAGSLGFAVAFVVACGGGTGLLSSEQAAEPQRPAQLRRLGRRRPGNAAAPAAPPQSFQNQVAALPSTVNSTLARNLGQGASTLSHWPPATARVRARARVTAPRRAPPAVDDQLDQHDDGHQFDHHVQLHQRRDRNQSRR